MTHDLARTDAGAATSSATAQGRASLRRARYLQVLSWCFAVFNTTRLLTYVPTMWAIHTSANSSQYSLLTWLAWVGANASMAAWLYEQQGRKLDKATLVNVGNAAMCLATSALIYAYR